MFICFWITYVNQCKVTNIVKHKSFQQRGISIHWPVENTTRIGIASIALAGEIFLSSESRKIFWTEAMASRPTQLKMVHIILKTVNNDRIRLSLNRWFTIDLIYLFKNSKPSILAMHVTPNMPVSHIMLNIPHWPCPAGHVMLDESCWTSLIDHACPAGHVMLDGSCWTSVIDHVLLAMSCWMDHAGHLSLTMSC